MPIETQIKTSQTLEKTTNEKTSQATEVLCEKSRNLGRVIAQHPEYGSNSAELYLLAYLEELGSTKI